MYEIYAYWERRLYIVFRKAIFLSTFNRSRKKRERKSGAHTEIRLGDFLH